jgi:hypothetical protein
MRLSFITLPLSAILLLAGCAAESPYKPAARPDAVGYSDTKLANDHYRIVFKGTSATSADKTRDYALYRAAQLTLENGGDWFQVANKNTEESKRVVDSGPDFVSPPQTVVYQRCGLVTCQSVVSTTPGYVVDDGITTTTSQYTSQLDIVIGKYPKPDSTQAYDARELVANLKSTVAPQQQAAAQQAK